MTAVKRYDRITLDRSRAIRLDNGMMKVPARISRVGVQEYRKADGSIERAYRPPDEVGAPASVESFDLVPLVNDHPYAEGGAVTADNSKRLTVGMVGSPKFAGQFVEAMLLISDAEAVKAVDGGKLEMSAGYYTDRDETPGVTADGQHYDFVQRNIRGNHVAIVWDGRAGRDVRIQLDAAIQVESETNPPKADKTKETTMKIVIDGSEVEVNEMAATFIARERKLSEGLLETAKAELKVAKAEIEKKSAQCDAANAEVTKLQAELKAEPAKAEARLAERTALVSKAKALAPELKCDALDAMGIKRGVLAVKSPEIKLDGKTDDYVNALFDHVCAQAEKTNPATEAVEAAIKNTTPVADAKNIDAKTARKASEDEFFGRSALKK